MAAKVKHGPRGRALTGAITGRSQRKSRRRGEQCGALPCSTVMARPYIHWRKLASGRQSSEDRAEVYERGEDLVVVRGITLRCFISRGMVSCGIVGSGFRFLAQFSP